MKVSFEIETAFKFTAQGVDMNVDLAAVASDLYVDIFAYGLKQKIADAASGKAKFAEENGMDPYEAAETLMAKCVERLNSGDWGARRASGPAADPLDEFRVKVVRKALGNNPKAKAAYDALDPKDQKARREFLLEIAAKFADKVDPQAEKLRAEHERAKGLDIDIAI